MHRTTVAAMERRWRLGIRALAVLVGLTLLAAGCGGGDEDSTPEPKPIKEPEPEKPKITESKSVATKPTAEKDNSTKILVASVGMIAVIVVSAIIALAFFSSEPATVASNCAITAMKP